MFSICSMPSSPSARGFFDIKIHASVWAFRSINRIRERSLRIGSATDHARAMKLKQWPIKVPHPARRHLVFLLFFADGIWFEIHVLTGIRKRGRVMAKDSG